MRAQFVWNLPRLSSAGRVVGAVLNDWSVSGIWSGATGAAYSLLAAYQNGGGNVNITGSPDYGGRVRIGGEEWSARSYLDDQVLAEGQTVDVIQIEGATALVAE